MTTTTTRHRVDGMGVPDGGHAVGPGFVILWDVASPEAVLRAVLDRLEWLDSGRSACPAAGGPALDALRSLLASGPEGAHVG
jgi:hypothetical protein